MREEARATPGDLDCLFNPRSIAVIGASSDPRKISGRPIQLLKSSGFSRPIYPINPQSSRVQGLDAHARLEDVRGEVDQALIGLPAALVPAAVEASIAKGVRSIVIFSAGFSETGVAGLEAQQRLASRCAENGVRLLGPNCLGLVSFASGAYATFSHSLEFAPPLPGPVAMVSQSGAVGTYALVKGVRREIRFSRFAATGNEADVDVAACIAWFAADPETKVILAYLESCRDGRRLAAALELARLAHKPVIVLKGGSSATGSSAAASHTGALAGSDAVYDAVFRQAGAARVHSFDEMLDLAYACSQPVLPAGRKLGVVTVSGGFGVMIADAAAPLDIQLPPLSAEAQRKIRNTLAFAAPANPVDVTPQLINNFALLPPVLDAMLAEERFDAIVAFFGTMGLDLHLIEALKAAMLDVKRRFPERLFALCMMTTPEARRALEAAELMVFEDPDRLVAVIARLAGFRQAFERPAARQPQFRVRESRAPLRGPLSEVDAKALLSAAGVRFAPERLVASAEAAVAAAAEFGGAVALKIVAPEIAHKSDIGGVLLGLVEPRAVEAGYSAILRNARTAHPDVGVDGVLVTPMVVGGVETVMGVNNDPDFGPVVMFGLGGVHVEAFKDVTFRLAPVDEDEAIAMIRAIKGFPILAGARGRPPADLVALARALAALSRFAADHCDDVATIDVNPFIALPDGGCAVDALIVMRDRAPSLQTGN